MKWETVLYCKPCKNGTTHRIRLITNAGVFKYLSACCLVCGNHYTDWVSHCDFLNILEARIGKIQK